MWPNDSIMATESKKQRQVAEIIRRHFSMVLQQEGPNIYGSAVMVTITNVLMSPDLGIAKIYLSVYNTENKQAVILMMEEEMMRLKSQLTHRIRKQVRRIPNIHFYMDDTLDEMYKLNALFDRLDSENQMGSKEEE